MRKGFHSPTRLLAQAGGGVLTVHLLGHVYFHSAQPLMNLSKKSVALMTYLALEGRAHHRERLAELLWDSPKGQGNLRVELTRLRQQHVHLFPSRQPMMSLTCSTDLEQVMRQAPQISAQGVGEWLSVLRGPPMSGLEDLGSLEFRAWVDQRKSQINDQLEGVLTQVYRRFERQGEQQAAGLVQARADLLGLNLQGAERQGAYLQGAEGLSNRADLPGPSAVRFQWPDTVAAFRAVFQLAQQAPQLVLLQGHSGSRRGVLQAAVAGTPWQAVQLQGSAQKNLLRAALIQHLSRLVPSGKAAAPPPSAHGDSDLIQMADLLERAAVPIVIAVHDADAASDWVSSGVRFALDLPLPLVLVLCTPLQRSPQALQSALGQVDWGRTHRISMPPLGIQGVAQALRGLHPPQPPGEGDAWTAAARLAQQSEGSPLYAQALYRHPGSQSRMPDEVRSVMLSELSYLPEDVLDGLSRLAQIPDRFEPDVAAAVLGDPAPRLLSEAVKHRLLLGAGPTEIVRLPELTHRPSDAHHHLTFASETLRVALAGLLPALERQVVRRQLADFSRVPPLTSAPESVPPCPALVDSAPLNSGLVHSASISPLPDPPLSPPVRVQAVLRAPGGSGLEQPRRELRTANGYRVALEGGMLEVLRRGRGGPPPLLVLAWPEVPAGRWTLVARLDVLNLPTADLDAAHPYALSLRTGLEDRVCYSTAPLPDHLCGAVVHRFGGVLPLGGWFRLSGQSGAGPLELTFRAVDLALTVQALGWEGQPPLLPLPAPTTH